MADATFEVVDSSQPPSFNSWKRHSRTDQSSLFPSDPPNIFNVTIWDFETKLQRTLTPTEVNDLNTGRSYIAVFGIVAYGDQFGTHWYRFCNYHAYAGGANADSCIAWNLMGNGSKLPKY